MQLLERDPSSLPQHFGTLAARDALQPLTSWVAEHGLLLGNPVSGGVRVDVAVLQPLAVAVLQGGHDLLEVRRHRNLVVPARSGGQINFQFNQFRAAARLAVDSIFRRWGLGTLCVPPFLCVTKP